MFEEMTEQQAREQILEMTKEYCEKYHNQKKPYEKGDRIPYASRVYDADEMVNLVDSSLEFWLTSGRYTDEFEKKYFYVIRNEKHLVFCTEKEHTQYEM